MLQHTTTNLADLPERADLSELDAATLQPLEARFDPAWPEVWRELATSAYVSLLAVMDDAGAVGPTGAQTWRHLQTAATSFRG